MCKAPHVSGNMFSQEGAGHHQEHKVNLISHPSHEPERNDAASETILVLPTTSLCLLGLQVDGLKEDFLRGSLEQHFLRWNFYHLPAVTALKFTLDAKTTEDVRIMLIYLQKAPNFQHIFTFSLCVQVFTFMKQNCTATD